MKSNWKKLPGQIAGAKFTYRKMPNLVSIHDYNDGRYHVEYLGVSEIFKSLKLAKEYANHFLVYGVSKI